MKREKVVHLNHMRSGFDQQCEDDPDAFPRLGTTEL